MKAVLLTPRHGLFHTVRVPQGSSSISLRNAGRLPLWSFLQDATWERLSCHSIWKERNILILLTPTLRCLSLSLSFFFTTSVRGLSPPTAPAKVYRSWFSLPPFPIPRPGWCIFGFLSITPANFKVCFSFHHPPSPADLPTGAFSWSLSQLFVSVTVPCCACTAVLLD